ncbi:hypothetical protein HDV05_004294 [Chytridiales sp. JEL 0842]|nr:hypothetical protein HDV05_004294 [Chytridiales sp. JEL 0842]
MMASTAASRSLQHSRRITSTACLASQTSPLSRIESLDLSFLNKTTPYESHQRRHHASTSSSSVSKGAPLKTKVKIPPPHSTTPKFPLPKPKPKTLNKHPVTSSLVSKLSAEDREIIKLRKRFVDSYHALLLATSLALKSSQDTADTQNLLLSSSPTPPSETKVTAVPLHEISSQLSLNNNSTAAPFWKTRASEGGLSKFASMFPQTFSLSGRSKIIPADPENGREKDVVMYESYISLLPTSSSREDPGEVFDGYRRDGFHTAPTYAEVLPFELKRCKVPKGFEIIYAGDVERCERWVRKEFVSHVDPKSGEWVPKEGLVVGIDTETTVPRYGPRRPESAGPSLLQISTSTSCLLVHLDALTPTTSSLSSLPRHIPFSISWLLSHPKITKITVEAAAELQSLSQLKVIPSSNIPSNKIPSSALRPTPQNFIDIAHYANITQLFIPPSGILYGSTYGPRGSSRKPGLSELVAVYMGLELWKPRLIRVGDWTAPDKFSAEKKEYAALDAWAPLKLYYVLEGTESKVGKDVGREIKEELNEVVEGKVFGKESELARMAKGVWRRRCMVDLEQWGKKLGMRERPLREKLELAMDGVGYVLISKNKKGARWVFEEVVDGDGNRKGMDPEDALEACWKAIDYGTTTKRIE